MKKGGIKLFFAMLFLAGAGFTLGACTGNENVNEGPQTVETTSHNEDTATTTSTTTSTEDTTSHTEDTTTTSTDNSTTSTEDPTDDPTEPSEDETEKEIERIGYEVKIENLLAYKLDERFEEKTADNVDAKYFTLRDTYQFGKSFETSGTIKLSATGEEKTVVLGLPMTEKQYQDAQSLNFNQTIAQNANLYQNYSNEQLEFASNFIENEDLTFNYAILDGYMWNLDVMTPTKMESLIEEKAMYAVNDYFMTLSGSNEVSSVDLKTVSFNDNYSIYGKCIILSGTTTKLNGKTKTFTIMFGTNEENYQYLKSVINSNGSEEMDMSQNYSKNEMSQIYNIIEDDSTEVKAFTVSSATFNYAELMNQENNF